MLYKLVLGPDTHLTYKLSRESATLREMLNIPTLDNRRKYFYLCELYKLRQNVFPNICAPPQAPINRYNRRSSTSSNLYYPRMNKKVGQRSSDNLGPQTYNMLPDIIKTSLTFQIFKTRPTLIIETLSAWSQMTSLFMNCHHCHHCHNCKLTLRGQHLYCSL